MWIIYTPVFILHCLTAIKTCTSPYKRYSKETLNHNCVVVLSNPVCKLSNELNREKKNCKKRKKYKYFREISHLLCTDGRFTIIMRKLYELAAVGSTYEEIKQRGHLKRRRAMVWKWNTAGRVGISGLCWRCGDCLLDQGENKRGQAMLSGLNPQRQHQND